MKHLLIIGGDRAALDTLEAAFWEADYHSILACRTVADARPMLRLLQPNLIVVVPHEQSAMPADELARLSEEAGAPIIIATADPDAALRCLGPAVSLDGPYPADAIASAAEHVSSDYAHAA